jgi:SecD/SecF fusion protein
MWTKRERHFKYFTGLSKSIFKKAHFRFIEIRKYTYMVSAVVLLLGIGSFINGFDYGVDFAGGRSYDIRFEGKHTVNEIREKLKPSFGVEPIVKTIGTDNTFNITTSYLITDPSKNATERVRAKLYEGLKNGGLIAANTTPEQFYEYVRTKGQERTVLPIISEDLKRGAVKATIISLLAIFFYILIRFRKWQYSLGTIISLLHDACITLAVFSFLRGHVPFALEIDQHFIAALLTVIGFSMNDTVIVFDRVREYFRKSPGEGKRSVINRAINDTLSRTIMTSLTVFLVILILFIFGGEATRGFAFAMLVGVITGTYSSIFVAAPILVDMDKSNALSNEVDKEARIEELKKLA